MIIINSVICRRLPNYLRVNYPVRKISRKCHKSKKPSNRKWGQVLPVRQKSETAHQRDVVIQLRRGFNSRDQLLIFYLLCLGFRHYLQHITCSNNDIKKLHPTDIEAQSIFYRCGKSTTRIFSYISEYWYRLNVKNEP